MIILGYFFLKLHKNMTLCILTRSALQRHCTHNIRFIEELRKSSGPICSKLTMSLVNDSLKFTSSDTQIC